GSHARGPGAAVDALAKHVEHVVKIVGARVIDRTVGHPSAARILRRAGPAVAAVIRFIARPEHETFQSPWPAQRAREDVGLELLNGAAEGPLVADRHMSAGPIARRNHRTGIVGR